MIKKTHKEECGTCDFWSDKMTSTYMGISGQCSCPDINISFPGTMSRSIVPADYACGTNWKAKR